MAAPKCPDHLVCEDVLAIDGAGMVQRGQTVKVGSSQKRWRFLRHVLNLRSGAEWVTLYGPLTPVKGGGYKPADAAQFVSVDPERVVIPRSQ